MIFKKRSKRNQRRLSATQQIQRWIKPIALLILISVIIWGVYQYNPSKLLNVKTNWIIDNPNLVTQKTLEQTIKPLVNKLHTLDLNAIKHKLEQHPWVLKAQVKRLFLGVIGINITTHQVASFWQNINCKQNRPNNCKGYISKQGQLITPKNLFYHQKNNNDKQLIKLKSTYNLAKSNLLLSDYQAYQQILNKMKISTFVRSNIDTLTIKPNITVVLGYSQQQQRLQRFIKIYAQLRKKIPLRKLNKATYDMRYPKGFALKY
jgi:cell division protein FtsQ